MHRVHLEFCKVEPCNKVVLVWKIKPANNFFLKPAIGQAREKVWPDMQPVLLDKKEFQCNKIRVEKKNVFTIF